MGKSKNNYALINNRMKTHVEMAKQQIRAVDAVKKLKEYMNQKTLEVASKVAPALGVQQEPSDSELKLPQG